MAEPLHTGAAPLVERLRSVHLQMVDAVLTGEGLQRVAELCAAAAGGPVAIEVPRLAAAVVAPPGGGDVAGVAAEVPIASGDEVIGRVSLRGARAAPDAAEFLHLAAVASLTEVAVEEAKDEVERNLRGSFLEDLRSRPDLEPGDIVRRAARLGCDLSEGGVALCAELTADRPRHVAAIIAAEHPAALAQHLDGRVYALLPAAAGRPEIKGSGAHGAGGEWAAGERSGRDRASAAQAGAGRLAARLQRHGIVGLSSFCGDPGELGRAVQEAELVLDVLRQGDGTGMSSEEIGTGTYRLLFRVLASHPEEVRAFFEDTVAPIVGYDAQYGTDLVGTLDAYLGHDCSMKATAAAIYAHRHTVAYRLDRVRELTGLDPVRSDDRERLGLGLKAYRIMAPRLPR